MLNYLVFYAVYKNDGNIDVINILPARSKRKRVKWFKNWARLWNKMNLQYICI